jgi:type III secretion protein U
MAEDKTEQPTPQRLEKARREGDSGASAYARQAVAFVVALVLVPTAAVATSSRCAAWLHGAIAASGDRPAPTRFDALELGEALLSLAGPVLLASAVAAAAVGVVQTGGAVASSRLAPDLGRLDPIEGLRKLWSLERSFTVARALLTASAVAYLVYRELASHAVDFARTVGQPGIIARLGGGLAGAVARDVAILGLVVAALDVAVVRSSWKKRLKMSLAEVKREHRESEGDPHVKAARERARRELLAQATVASVKEASVVVVNPTHLACALRYAEDEDGAPVVVASGEGDLAERIIRAARDYGVPIVRDVPLARALRELEVGEVIPEALYEAVAEILRAAWEESDPPRTKDGPA